MNYLPGMRHVFERGEGISRPRASAIFLAFSRTGLGFHQLLMHLGTAGLGIRYLLVKLVAAVIVMADNFITRKLFLERRSA